MFTNFSTGVPNSTIGLSNTNGGESWVSQDSQMQIVLIENQLVVFHSGAIWLPETDVSPWIRRECQKWPLLLCHVGMVTIKKLDGKNWFGWLHVFCSCRNLVASFCARHCAQVYIELSLANQEVTCNGFGIHGPFLILDVCVASIENFSASLVS